MDIGLHEIAQSRKDQPMPRQRRQPGKGSTDHPHAEMAATITRASVTAMLLAVIDQLQLQRLQGQPGGGSDFFHPLLVHGSTRLNGSTSTLLNTPAAR